MAVLDDGSFEDIGRRLKFLQSEMKALVDVMSMRALYFCDVSEKGV